MAENHSMDATRRYRPFFAVVGITKLTGTGNTAGSLDLLGVALLFSRRLTCYGAIVIAFIAGLATLISLTVLQGNPVWGTLDMVFVPLIITTLAIIPAWLTRPA
jgi:hypothetical protein